MKATKYAIICGAQRSGTRQFCDYLTRHSAVNMQGELSPRLMKQVAETMAMADAVYTGERHKKYFGRKRARAVVEMFGFFSKARRFENWNAKVQGFKTPHAELHWQELNNTILPSFKELHYFYCIRNLKDTWLSLGAMPWFTLDAHEYLDKYLTSLQTAIDMRKTMPEGASIHALCLDDYIACKQKPDFLIEKLYGPLTLKVGRKRAREFVQTTENTNSTKNRTGTQRPSELSDEQLHVFVGKADHLCAVTAEFNGLFGTSLVNDFAQSTSIKATAKDVAAQ